MSAASLLPSSPALKPFRFGPTLLIVALAAVALAPASGRSAIVPLRTTSDVLRSYDALVRADAGELVRHVAALVGDAFAVPLPPDVVLGLYPDRHAFAHALVREVGLAPRLAFELAGTAIGVALPRTVFLLTEREDPDRVRLVAHEVMHLAQIELTGPEARPPRWLTEGSAEWAALTVLDRLGVDGVAERRWRARDAAHVYLTTHPEFTLALVDGAGDFRRWERATGSLVAYQVAYAMAEQLVARSGVAALVDYFRAFRDDGDSAKHFARVFGTTTARFARDARAAIARSAAARPS
jgi:hypothetical protein